MCEYCKKKKSIKETENGSYYKIIGNEIEHHEECLDSYYSFTEKIPINFCPMCGSLLKVPDIKPIDNGVEAMATAEITNPILQEKTIINDIQKAINESILNSVTRDAGGKLNLSKNFMKGGSM